MSEVLDELARSKDLIDQEIARVLRVYQNIKASRGLSRALGYEPKDIRQLGAVEVIQRRIRNYSSGFDIVPAKDSYEWIAVKYPDRFEADVVAIARDRIGQEEKAFSPTADPQELDEKVRLLLERTFLPLPPGTMNPQKATTSTTAFLRDPRVKAFVLKQARGHCEACGTSAPFKTALGVDFLEVHHMKPLVDGGSDRVQNAVAVCPNCHRALHYASDAGERADRIYQKSLRVRRE